MDKLECYTVLLHSRTNEDKSVNSASLSLFCQMSRPILTTFHPPELR